jgi:hypothetical protein
MVFLADLRNEWPWNANAEPQMKDKEVFSQMVTDVSHTWRIRIPSPMKGFAFLGVRFLPLAAAADESAMARLVRQDTGILDATVFGFPWDQALLTAGLWQPLGFPLTPTLCRFTHLEMIIKMDKPFIGKVEFLAQKIHDLLDGEVSLGLLHDRKRRLEWIQDRRGSLHFPGYGLISHPIKLVPSLHRLLNKKEPEWEDREMSCYGVEADQTLYEIPPYPAPKEDE